MCKRHLKIKGIVIFKGYIVAFTSLAVEMVWCILTSLFFLVYSNFSLNINKYFKFKKIKFDQFLNKRNKNVINHRRFLRG